MNIDTGESKLEGAIKKPETTNEGLLKLFEACLRDDGLVKKTIKNHIDNISFFGTFLNQYASNLDEVKTFPAADESDVASFLGDWFSRKAMWGSPAEVKANISSFKKFFGWMCAQELIDKAKVNDLKSLIQEEKAFWIEATSF